MRWPWSKANDPELDEEIQAHLAIEAKQRVERGESPDDAERAARRQFGNVGMVREATRTVWTYPWFESFLQDLGYAVRVARKSPGFTTVAVLTLALGIGANTAIFSVVDSALLRPLPFPHAERLATITSTKGGLPIGLSAMDGRDFAAASRSFEGVVVYDHWRKNVSGIQGSVEPAEMVIGLVPGEYFELLQLQPILGRPFTREESQFGKHFVAAIGENFWRMRFAADRGVLGKTLRINGETYSIVAVYPDVIPPWMDSVSVPISIWTPFAFADTWTEAARAARGNGSVARLKPGVAYEQARAELQAIASRLAREHPADDGIGVTIEPLADTRAGPVKPILLMLGGAVGMVLLIACANLAGLLVARNSARYREMAVRSALGAGRWRLVRQLLLETLVLSFAGGVVGLGVAAAVGKALLYLNSSHNLPYTAASNALAQFWPSAPDFRILLFAFGISVVTALLFGIGPAFTGARVSLADTLREGGRSGSVGANRQRFRRVLVMSEVALSLVLVVAASLLVQTMIRLQRQDPGFRPDHLFIGHIYVPPARYVEPAAITRFCDQLRDRVRALPGVLDVSINLGMPPSINWSKPFTVDGVSVSRVTDLPAANFSTVDSEYLKTFGLSVINGRGFEDSDTAASQQVALVNEEFARHYFTGRYPIGQQIQLREQQTNPRLTVVGVVKNFMNAGIARPPVPQIITLFRQQPEFNYGFKDIVVRTAMNPESTAPAIARELRALDPDIPLGEIRSMDAQMSNQTADTRFTTVLLGLFAGLGVILAVIGAYGVVAYLVAQRTQELGVRLALGANANDILWLILRYGLSIGLVGVVTGLAGAMIARQFLTRLLYGVSGSDPATLAGASLVLLLAVVTACLVPARRAMRIDPVQALRSE